MVGPELALLGCCPGGLGCGHGLVVDLGEGVVFVGEGELVGVFGDELFKGFVGGGAVGALEVGEFDEEDFLVGVAGGGGGSYGLFRVGSEGLGGGLLGLLLGFLLLLLVGLDGFEDSFGVVADNLEDLLFELGGKGGGDRLERG